MRIAHLSDFHFYRFSDWSGLLSKQLLGLTNLHLMGRAHHFSAEVAALAIAAAVDDGPDVVVLTGDLTALGTPSEFMMARDALEPLLSRYPTVVIPGNHDYYTADAERFHRIEQYFGREIRTPERSLSEPIYPTLHLLDKVAIIGLNPCRATLASTGRLDPAEAERLEALLLQPEVSRRFTILLIHYPLFDAHGELPTKFWRRLENQEILLDILLRHQVGLVLHGHDHHRYLNHLHREGSPPTYLYNAGSAAFDRGFDYPIRASYNLYDIVEGELTRVIHKDYSPEGFRVSYDGPPSRTRLEAPKAMGGY